MAVRTSLQLGLSRRILAAELALAVLGGVVVGLGTGAPETPSGLVPVVIVVAGIALLAILLFLFRRTAPLVPFALSAVLAAISPAVTIAMLITSYAVGRYVRQWPLRTGAAPTAVRPFAIARATI